MSSAEVSEAHTLHRLRYSCSSSRNTDNNNFYYVGTRFPTEVILRRSQDTKIKITIQAYHTNRPTEELSKINGFNETLKSLVEFPGIVKKAMEAMGITSSSVMFSDDVLRVEISGPDRPLLTLIDLPGLFQSKITSHGGESREQIERMVDRYMADPRSIILAVVSASDNISNQGVLGMAQLHDPHGIRTLGIITKPDLSGVGTGLERHFFDLGHNNREVYVKYLYHPFGAFPSEVLTMSNHEHKY